ncbi:gamma-glutamylcyclotransferase [Rubrivivax gelatinosus]|uniref:glutathione-specific gamma-glutamylcyclotransferase n=1 Tax=Rubrivivax gelatinosus TaxID=28068 RepID=A0A4R2MBZ0_RUBGE|nr:gamma-glutamylcyclotransferase [Rubrivivax gelatinosus]MBK1688106.1 gamma-glutamylcyclotransferase [Rubrivivax gelatinosus]TCP03831.1 cation transport protein ChaC [Rubrivivax gelatinosus]
MSACPHDPAARLALLRAQWGGRGDLWVFGYASLIWRPEFEAAEHRPALVRGWHRALRMRSQINRGTPQQPGLVFALMGGGACRGFVYRMRPETAEAELERLWDREMVGGGIYDPRFLPCQTPQGTVAALAFTLSRRSEHYTGRLCDEDVVAILRHARGRYGTTLQYLAETAGALRERGVHDREIERLMRVAAGAGLPVHTDDQPAAARRVGRRSESRSSSVSSSASTPGSSTSTPTAG